MRVCAFMYMCMCDLYVCFVCTYVCVEYWMEMLLFIFIRTLQEHHQTVARKQLPNEAVVKTDVGQGAVPSVGQGAVPSAKHSRPPEPSVWQVARQHVVSTLQYFCNLH